MRNTDEQLRSALVAELNKSIARIEAHALERPAEICEILFALEKQFRSLREETNDKFKWIEARPD